MDSYPRSDERSRMVEHQIRARGITNPRLLTAMREIPRHLFIPPPYNTSAYEDAPLPIGNGQTISQPYIVALMTELLDPQPEDRVLEIGAGSGYQAAILSRLVQHVTTIERIPGVADLARRNIEELGLKNISIIVGDGTLGYPWTCTVRRDRHNGGYAGNSPAPDRSTCSRGNTGCTGREPGYPGAGHPDKNRKRDSTLPPTGGFALSRSSANMAGRIPDAHYRYNPAPVRRFRCISRRYAPVFYAGRSRSLPDLRTPDEQPFRDPYRCAGPLPEIRADY